MQECLFEIELDFEEEEEIVGKFEDSRKKELVFLQDDFFMPIPFDFKRMYVNLRLSLFQRRKQNFVEFEFKKEIKEWIGKREEE